MMIPHPLRRPPDILGRRGASLLIYGTTWIVVAASVILRPTRTETDLFAFIPTVLHAGLWAAAGAVAIVYAFRRTPGADTPGWVALVVVALARAFTYAWAWLASALPWSEDGDPRAWLGAICWAVIALKIVTDAGWPETSITTTPEHRGVG